MQLSQMIIFLFVKILSGGGGGGGIYDVIMTRIAINL